MVNRFDIYLVNLDPEIVGDAKVARPAIVISPDEMNAHTAHVVTAPISSSTLAYPTRIPIDLLNDRRYVILDQLRATDKDRLVKKIGSLDNETQDLIIESLTEFFAK